MNSHTRPRTQGEGSLPFWHQPSKVTPAQRYEISLRRGDGESIMDLAAEYGVGRSVIANCPVVYR